MENINETTAETTANTPEDVSATEVADSSKNNDVEFSDGAESENESKKDESKQLEEPKQEHNKTNADYARERRKQEQEKALKKAKYDAIIDALDGINPYTQEKMEDAEDVEEYLTMKEIDKKGQDPVADYSKFLKAKNKEQNKQKELESSQEEWIRNDKNDFSSKHPDVNLDKLIDDDMFKLFAQGKVGKMSMDKIYTDYLSFSSKIEEQAKDRAAQVLANNAATPGKLSNQASSKIDISKMSSSEFDKLIEKAKRGELKNL